MDIKQAVCPHCGMLNEYRQISSFSDALPNCRFCGKVMGDRQRRDFIPLGQNSHLQLRHISGRGMGVVTSLLIPEKSLVERCPAFVVEVNPHLLALAMAPYSDSKDNIRLGHMLFPWIVDEAEDTTKKYRVLLLGYGMLYNHERSTHSNLRHEPYIDPDTNRRFVDFYAKRNIDAGEELTHTYTDPDRLWFLEKPGLGQ